MNSARSLVDPDAALFIAEAGVNHNGDVELAERLIDAASEAGADAVKFQTFTADRLATEAAPKAEYQNEAVGEKSQHEMLRELELPSEAHIRLQEYCRERNITFLSTPFDVASATLLDELDVPLIKLGSGELNHAPLLEHVAELGRPIILSTGMGTMDEVRAARERIRAVDPDLHLTFLHCTSEYPTDLADANVRAMGRMATELPEPVGYSDHTTEVTTPAFAVAAGASIVEKHFTLDRTLPGPDHRASLEPDELSESVSLVRQASTALGSPEKVPTPAEIENRKVIRKSLHAARAIGVGETLSAADVSVTRPADGLAPTAYESVLGRTVTSDLAPGDPLTAESLSAETDGGGGNGAGDDR
ncbi:N-acetylneuraminate synthase [Halobium salinum]|uniref:N-acetylneuraminate synthase n=1 Tax=Halobium salinum TaxID=1364940 RepID=A0ABD5PAG0_9EURY|nr:N-acetylneuraminate synthase [Halobium salinum]